jgi:hypothetical protein
MLHVAGCRAIYLSASDLFLNSPGRCWRKAKNAIKMVNGLHMHSSVCPPSRGSSQHLRVHCVCAARGRADSRAREVNKIFERSFLLVKSRPRSQNWSINNKENYLLWRRAQKAEHHLPSTDDGLKINSRATHSTVKNAVLTCEKSISDINNNLPTFFCH